MNDAKCFISELDKIAEKRKKEILSTTTKVTVSGTKYYLSNKGDDTNDGLSPENPWRTLAKLRGEVNKGTIKAGDGILFRRGDRFDGEHRIYENGSLSALSVPGGVTVSAYGEGEKPIITCSEENAADPKKWTLLEGTSDIWEYYKDCLDIGVIIVNDGEGCILKEDPDVKNGEYYKPWTDEKFDLVRDLRDMRFISYLAGNCHLQTGKLYFRCSKGNPGALFETLDLCPRLICISLMGDGIAVDNLCVKYAGILAIAGGTRKDITVTNCEIAWIGGCVHYYRFGHECVRYGNGIQLYGGAVNYTVDNCYVHDIFDAGITHQYGGGDAPTTMENVQYSNNLVEDCQYSLEYFHQYAADKNIRRDGRNVKIFRNICRRAGYGFGHDRSMCNGEIPAGHLITWQHKNECDEGTFIIHDNIFDRSAKQMFTPYAEKTEWYPVFNGNTYVMVEGTPLGRYKGNDYGWQENMKEILPEVLEDKNATVYIADAQEFGFKK